MTELLAASLVCGLASYRLWRIGAEDTITEPARLWWLSRPEPGRVASFLWAMASCAWCLGFWIAGGLSAAVVWLLALGGPLEWALLWLASSAVAGALDNWLHRG